MPKYIQNWQIVLIPIWCYFVHKIRLTTTKKTKQKIGMANVDKEPVSNINNNNNGIHAA